VEGHPGIKAIYSLDESLTVEGHPGIQAIYSLESYQVQKKPLNLMSHQQKIWENVIDGTICWQRTRVMDG
jgi:hypothetical protein